jgi:hypothetical protein
MTTCTCDRGPNEEHKPTCQVTMRAYFARVATDLRDLLNLTYLPYHAPTNPTNADLVTCDA